MNGEGVAVDWMATLNEAGLLVRNTEADTRKLLASETLSVEHAVRLLDAVSEMSEDFDEILYELEADEGADEELIQAALAIEALWSELSLACLNKVRILRGMPPITISMTGSDEDGEEP